MWLIDAAGGEPTQLSKGIGSTFLSPEWMPDGKYIVVSRARPFSGLEKLWLYHVDGGTGLEMVGGSGAQRMLGAAVDGSRSIGDTRGSGQPDGEFRRTVCQAARSKTRRQRRER
ncbi:TolB family protein [Candidatus Palauibacter sp.]|uniref:TolB family protein n=1 Tax=Candidatus Palauibacter sp. TaxID=3101350 RepID=UPI003B02B79D